MLALAIAAGQRRQRQLVVVELLRIDVDVVLLGQSAEARHVDHARHRLELLFEHPVLDFLFREQVVVRAFDDVAVDLADRIVGRNRGRKVPAAG